MMDWDGEMKLKPLDYVQGFFFGFSFCGTGKIPKLLPNAVQVRACRFSEYPSIDQEDDS
jgi:hypothetical protein